MTEPTSGDDALRQEVEALNVTLVALYDKLEDLITKDEAEKSFPTREEARRARWRTAGTVLMSVFIALVLTIFANNYAVTHCFLNTGTPNKSGVCDLMFPGYNESVEESRQRLSQFQELVDQIPKNTSVNEEQNRQLAEIKRLLEEMRNAR